MNKPVPGSPQFRSQWFGNRSASAGLLAFMLHRLTGFGLVFYLFLHLAALNLLRSGPQSWDRFIALPNFDLLPNRANVKQAVDQYGRVYTFEQTFYERGLEWWRKRLAQVYLSSGGAKTVAISTRPLLSEPDLPGNNRETVLMAGTPIALRDWRIRPLADGRWQVTLFWQAQRPPSGDYLLAVELWDEAGRNRFNSPAQLKRVPF